MDEQKQMSEEDILATKVEEDLRKERAALEGMGVYVSPTAAEDLQSVHMPKGITSFIAFGYEPDGKIHIIWNQMDTEKARKAFFYFVERYIRINDQLADAMIQTVREIQDVVRKEIIAKSPEMEREFREATMASFLNSVESVVLSDRTTASLIMSHVQALARKMKEEEKAKKAQEEAEVLSK